MFLVCYVTQTWVTSFMHTEMALYWLVGGGGGALPDY
jgi:hypothetical protein